MPVVPQPSPTISIRKATSEDAAQILACLRAAFETTGSSALAGDFDSVLREPSLSSSRRRES